MCVVVVSVVCVVCALFVLCCLCVRRAIEFSTVGKVSPLIDHSVLELGPRHTRLYPP